MTCVPLAVELEGSTDTGAKGEQGADFNETETFRCFKVFRMKEAPAVSLPLRSALQMVQKGPCNPRCEEKVPSPSPQRATENIRNKSKYV